MINLLPPEIKSSIKYGFYNTNLARYICLVIVVGLIVVGFIVFKAQTLHSDIAKLNSSVTTKKKQKTEYTQDILKAEALIRKIQATSMLLDNQIDFSTIFREISKLMPSDVVLDNLNLTSRLDQTSELRIRAVSQQSITKLQQNLVNSDLFTSVSIQATQFNKDAPTHRYVVQITVVFDKERVKSL